MRWLPACVLGRAAHSHSRRTDSARDISALAGVGRSQETGPAWDAAGASLTGPAAVAWRILRAGWGWVTTSTYEQEQAHLQAHPELLTPGSETVLTDVLRYQSLEEADRYLSILDHARRTDIDTAYQQARGKLQGPQPRRPVTRGCPCSSALLSYGGPPSLSRNSRPTAPSHHRADAPPHRRPPARRAAVYRRRLGQVRRPAAQDTPIGCTAMRR